MGLYPLIITTACYALVALDMLIARNYPMALAFTCYGLANVGFIWSLYR